MSKNLVNVTYRSLNQEFYLQSAFTTNVYNNVAFCYCRKLDKNKEDKGERCWIKRQNLRLYQEVPTINNFRVSPEEQKKLEQELEVLIDTGRIKL